MIVEKQTKCLICEQEFKQGDSIDILWAGLPDNPEPEGEAHKACIGTKKS